MAVLFSAVTLTANDQQTEFFVGGIPREFDDLEGWTAFDNFMEDLDEETEVGVHVETYLYGAEETYKATPEEVAYFMMRMNQDDIIAEYGWNRVQWVLANTIQQHSEDGRFSIANKEWANGYYMPEDDILWHYSVESHPGLVNLFVDRVQKEWQALGLFDRSHCTEDGDYKRKSHPHQNCEWHWKCYEKTDRRSDLLWLIVVFVFT